MRLADAVRESRPPAWLPALATIVGADHVLTSLPDLWAYSRDRSPYATFQVRNCKIPVTLPAAVACPADAQEVARIVSFTRDRGIAIIPFGAGSGVLGATLPLAGELVVDLKRLNRVVEIRDYDGMATVQAGMNGGQFEAALNKRGFTCGHLPQSLHMSTVGGWVACRSAGQNSSRYGKIEDMVLGFELILPDGRALRVRPVARRATGPGLKDLFIGSEGTLGILTQVTLRIWPLPQQKRGLVLAFPSLSSGIDALRRVMQAELRPAIARLHDEGESVQRAKGIAEAKLGAHPFLAILEFSGLPRLCEVESQLALEICEELGAVRIDDAPYEEWLKHRFTYSSATWHAQDYYCDTIEVTGRWGALPGMYASMRAAVMAASDQVSFGAHWSHVYPEGACQYMTVRVRPMAEARAMAILARIWDDLQRICLEMDGSISHHHGVGLFRGRWMPGELGVGLDVLRDIKGRLDPGNLFSPGKLGMTALEVAVTEGGAR